MQTKLIAALAALLLFSSSITGAYFYGRSDGKAICTATNLREYQKGVERNDEIERGTMGMDVPSLDRSLSRWMRPSS